MKSTMVNVILATAVALVTIAGCTKIALTGPPELRLGRDECRECGMIISEDRCSAAIIEERDGRREHVLFDDIGCMLDYERERLAGAVVRDRWVHDYGSRSWVSTATAVFLSAPPQKLVTPMSSGMVAFAAQSEGQRVREKYGGELVDYSALTAARTAWDQQRRAPAATDPGE